MTVYDSTSSCSNARDVESIIHYRDRLNEA